MLAMMKPISVPLDNMQRDNCNLLNVINVWKNLNETLKHYGSLKKFLNKQHKKALTQTQFLSYLMCYV